MSYSKKTHDHLFEKKEHYRTEFLRLSLESIELNLQMKNLELEKQSIRKRIANVDGYFFLANKQLNEYELNYNKTKENVKWFQYYKKK